MKRLRASPQLDHAARRDVYAHLLRSLFRYLYAPFMKLPSPDKQRMETIVELLQRNERERAWQEIQRLQDETKIITAKRLFEKSHPISS